MFLLKIVAAIALIAVIRAHEDEGLNVLELIEKYEYPLEVHPDVETEDGYLLEMHRIPHGLNNKADKDKKVALLVHGLTLSSANWVDHGNKSLAFILADLGYDVWMGNCRGNRWSRKHKTYDPDVDLPEFWSFSWHEIGKYDLPAFIDYVIDQTGVKQMQYVGHSQGTTAYFVMGAVRPEYNAKISLMSALAPIAYMSNMKSPVFKIIAQFEEQVEWIAENIGLWEFLPASNFSESLGAQCDESAAWEEFCLHMIFLIAGDDSEQLDPDMLPVITTNVPAGTSTRQFLHYAQEINSGHFRQYDYHSEEENLEVYGQPTPPDYDVSLISAPIALHYGQNDWLAALEDVDTFKDQLPNLVLDNKVAFPKWNHLDFLWATDVIELLYDDVIATMDKY